MSLGKGGMSGSRRVPFALVTVTDLNDRGGSGDSQQWG